MSVFTESGHTGTGVFDTYEEKRTSSLIYKGLTTLPEPEVPGEITEMEFDEMWHFIGSKKESFGSSRPLTVAHGELWAWVLGGRDSAAFRRLYDKVKHLENCTFYTDNWDAFADVLPPERHVIGKAHTIDIEHDNNSTRHHLGRFTRRTKVVSQKTFMVDLTLRIWHATPA